MRRRSNLSYAGPDNDGGNASWGNRQVGNLFCMGGRNGGPRFSSGDLGVVCVRDDHESSAKGKFILIPALPRFVILTSTITVDRIDRAPSGGTRGP
jgi:hypothetical protein